MACNNYSEDKKEEQIEHDLECSEASGIQSCKYNAWAPFYMEFRCLIDILFKQSFELLPLSNSNLTKRRHKNNAAE